LVCKDLEFHGSLRLPTSTGTREQPHSPLHNTCASSGITQVGDFDLDHFTLYLMPFASRSIADVNGQAYI